MARGRSQGLSLLTEEAGAKRGCCGDSSVTPWLSAALPRHHIPAAPHCTQTLSLLPRFSLLVSSSQLLSCSMPQVTLKMINRVQCPQISESEPQPLAVSLELWDIRNCKVQLSALFGFKATLLH